MAWCRSMGRQLGNTSDRCQVHGTASVAQVAQLCISFASLPHTHRRPATTQWKKASPSSRFLNGPSAPQPSKNAGSVSGSDLRACGRIRHATN